MGTVPPAYVQTFPPEFGVAAVNVTPTIDEAWAAVRSEQTLTVPPPAAAAFEGLAGALALTAGLPLLEVAVVAVLSDFFVDEHAAVASAKTMKTDATDRARTCIVAPSSLIYG